MITIFHRSKWHQKKVDRWAEEAPNVSIAIDFIFNAFSDSDLFDGYQFQV